MEIEHGGFDVLHPITRDTMPQLLNILKDVVDGEPSLQNYLLQTNAGQFIEYLLTDSIQYIIEQRICRETVVVSLGRPVAEVFVEKFAEILKQANRMVFEKKCLNIPQLTNRDKIIILRKMYLSSQIIAGLNTTALCKETRDFVKKNYPAADLSILEGVLRIILN